jgi:hypothetical protein
MSHVSHRSRQPTIRLPWHDGRETVAMFTYVSMYTYGYSSVGTSEGVRRRIQEAFGHALIEYPEIK